jgi:hypothetical protein
MSMITDQRSAVAAALDGIAEGNGAAILAMHLDEIEQEAGNLLDLMASLRSAGYHAERGRAEDVLADITIALEHLQSHGTAALDTLRTGLDLT